MFDIAAESYYCCDARQKVTSTASDPGNSFSVFCCKTIVEEAMC